jgi:hypothetical protein
MSDEKTGTAIDDLLDADYPSNDDVVEAEDQEEEKGDDNTVEDGAEDKPQPEA